MKVALISIIACVALLTGCANTSSCYSESCCDSGCGGSSGQDYTCQCADPACLPGGNPCLGPERCCRVYGNVGGFDRGF